MAILVPSCFNSGSTPVAYWLQAGCILAPYWFDTGCILVTVCILVVCILFAYCLHTVCILFACCLHVCMFACCLHAVWESGRHEKRVLTASWSSNRPSQTAKYLAPWPLSVVSGPWSVVGGPGRRLPAAWLCERRRLRPTPTANRLLTNCLHLYVRAHLIAHVIAHFIEVAA
jgi:hypothetical protein